MNILHSTGMPFPTKYGGFERWLTEVGRCAKVQGHTLYISYKQNKEGVEVFSDALDKVEARLVVLENDTEIEDFCIQKKIDIVHFHFDFMEHDRLYRNLSKKGIRSYATIHCECGYAVDPVWKKQVGTFVRIMGHRLKMHHRVRYFKQVLPCSRLVERQYSDFYLWPRKKVTPLYLGIPRNGDMQISRETETNDVPVIACVAFHSPVKGVDILLNALRILKDRKISVRCIQIGGGSSELKGEDTAQLKELCTSLDLDDVVEWVGVTNHVNNYLRQADIYCQPSRSEAICLSIAEAMAQGLPVVATDVGGIHELVENGKNGFLVQPENAEALANGLEQLLSDAVLRKKMGENSLQQLNELEFYQDVSVEKLYQIYRENGG